MGINSLNRKIKKANDAYRQIKMKCGKIIKN